MWEVKASNYGAKQAQQEAKDYAKKIGPNAGLGFALVGITEFPTVNDAMVQVWSPDFQLGGILYVVRNMTKDEKAPHDPKGFDHLPDLVGAGLAGLAFLGGLGWVIKQGGTFRPCPSGAC